MDVITLRTASPDDAAFLVPLITESSGGVWPVVWQTLSTPGESVNDAGARYLADNNNQLNTDNATIVEANDQRLGVILCYRELPPANATDTPATTTTLPDSLHKVLQPYRELSDPQSWFIAELCLLPQSRGRGIGSRLLQHAADTARQQKLPRLTLRVFSENTGAVALYQRFGFTITDTRAVLPHPQITVTGDVYLMSMNL